MDPEGCPLAPQCGMAWSRIKGAIGQAAAIAIDRSDAFDEGTAWEVEVWQAGKKVFVAGRLGGDAFLLESADLAERHMAPLRAALVCGLMHDPVLGERYSSAHEDHLALVLKDDVLRMVDRAEAPAWLAAELAAEVEG